MLPMSFNVALITTLIPTIAASKAIGDLETIKREYLFATTNNIDRVTMHSGINIFGGPILKLLFPSQSNGVFILQISAISIIFIVLEQTISGTLQGLGKSIVPAIALSVGVAIKLVLNLILVPINPDKFILGRSKWSKSSNSNLPFDYSYNRFCDFEKIINLKLKFSTFILKPILATVMMIICALFIYNKLIYIFAEKQV